MGSPFSTKIGGVSPYKQDDEGETEDFASKTKEVKDYYSKLLRGPATLDRAKEIYGSKASDVLSKKESLLENVTVRESDLDKNPKAVESYKKGINDVFVRSGLSSEDVSIFFDRTHEKHDEVRNKLIDHLETSSSDKEYMVDAINVIDWKGRSRYDTETGESVIGSYRSELQGVDPKSTIANEMAHGIGALGERGDLDVYRGIGKDIYAVDYTNPSMATGETLSYGEATRIFDNLKPGVLGRDDLAQDKGHQKASEVASDIQTLRYDLYRMNIYDPSKEELTQEHLDKAREQYKGDTKKLAKLKQLESIMDDAGLIDTMNYLVKNEGVDDQMMGGVGGNKMV